MLGPSGAGGGGVADKQRDVTKTRRQTNSRSAPTLCAVHTLRHTHTHHFLRQQNVQQQCRVHKKKKHFRSLSSTIYTHAPPRLFSLSGISESDIKLTNKLSNIISWTKTQCIDFFLCALPTHTNTHTSAHTMWLLQSVFSSECKSRPGAVKICSSGDPLYLILLGFSNKTHLAPASLQQSRANNSK